MAEMTPEQEASYALDFGVARSDLPPNAQLASSAQVPSAARTPGRPSRCRSPAQRWPVRNINAGRPWTVP
jgi:hypothetical protein